MSVASSTRSLSFAVSSARAAASAGARRTSATSVGNALRRSSTASSTVSAPRSSCAGGASPRRLASSGAISRCRFGPLLLERLDEETQPRERLGEQFQVLVADRRVRVRVAVDLLLAQAEQALGVVLLQHPQRAANLEAVLAERRELGAFRRGRGRTRRAPAPSAAGWPGSRARPARAGFAPARGGRSRRSALRCPRGSDAKPAPRRAATASPRPASGNCSAGCRSSRRRSRQAGCPSRTPSPAHPTRRPTAASRRAARRSDAVSCVSASLPISTAFAWTDCSGSFSFGRLSPRPSVTFSQMFLAAPSCSRTSRRIGWSRTRSAFSASADGISPPRPKPVWTDCTSASPAR